MIRPQDSLAMAMHPKRPERRLLALALAAVSCACLAYAAVSKTWMYNEATVLGGSYGFGPRGMFRCNPKLDVCESMTNGELIETWRREVVDVELKATMLGVVDLSLVTGEIHPVKLHRTGRTLAISNDSTSYDLDATTPDGVPGLYVATAKSMLADPVTDLEIDDYVAFEMERTHIRIRAGQVNREEAISDAQVKAKLIAEQNRSSSAFALCGWLAFVGALLASVSLGIAVVLVALKRRLMLPIMPTTTALLGIMLAIITGCVFVATKPGPSGFVGVSFGFWGFAAGIILGIASTLMLNRLLRPEDDVLAEPMNPDQF